jgi:hypothetical protein
LNFVGGSTSTFGIMKRAVARADAVSVATNELHAITTGDATVARMVLKKPRRAGSLDAAAIPDLTTGFVLAARTSTSGFVGNFGADAPAETNGLPSRAAFTRSAAVSPAGTTAA